MKRKIIAAIILLILVATVAFSGYRRWYNENHVEVEGVYIPCDTAELTLSGGELPSREALLRLTQLKTLDVRSVPVTVEEYERLRLDLPNCTILWKVPFQGSFLSQDTAVSAVQLCSSKIWM